MKKYSVPELEISKFDAVDIVTVSVAPMELSYTEEQDGGIRYTSELPEE